VSLAALLLALVSASDPPAPGGETTTHWAYRVPLRPALPAAIFPGWDASPIDRFVGARLAAEGLAPSPEAEPATLLRRASLDLTGLPPGPAELERFLADREPGAWERALERLLDSPHYGEHQAARWLDLARYADSRGYEKDDRREHWRWRDWVIEAFQRDLPFDEFTVEQLAGDLLPGATLEQQLATGFHRNTLVNEEGGIDPEEFRVAAVKDRVNTTALVWLGTTLECAQCHDHKYDPFTQTDYYRFLAFFDGTEDAGNADTVALPAPDAAFEARARLLEAERAELVARLAPEALGSEHEAWRSAWLAAEAGWRVVRPEGHRTSSGARLALLEDGSVLALGEPPDVDDYVLEATLAPGMLASGTLAALRLEVLTDESLPGKGPGRTEHRNFVLSGLRLALDGAPVPLGAARADHAQESYAPAGALDDDPRSGWAVAGGEGGAHALVVELAEPRALAQPARLTLTLEQRYGSRHLLGRARLSVRADAPPALEPVPAPGVPLAPADAERAAALAAWHAEHSPALAPLRARRAEIARELEPPRALVLRELREGRRTFVHERGNFLAPGAEVTPGVPEALPALQRADMGARATRLELARWLVDGANPLTARVTVNRVWQRLFGLGLVPTDNDFGLRGEPPSHPELLDWLALEFQARHWSTKELLRLILGSATYRQSSAATPAGLARDPGNRWLARGAKLRLEAESVRDNALAIAGLLAPRVGGPSVFPPQPEGIWQSPYSGDRWMESSGDERHRRGLYTFLKRSAPYPTALLFDAPSREIACSRRGTSNTPLQALALLNDPVFVECAEGLARRMLAEGGPDERARLAHGFRLCTARAPDEIELGLLLALVAAERAAGADEARAFQAAARVLLNLDETITKS
jgi:uncharacterized protein DUF1553/uncharacterized protein DUF1549